MLAADAAPADMLESSARATHLRRHGRLDEAKQAGFDVRAVERSLARYERAARRDAPWAAKRAAFATLARALESIHARNKQSTVHLQALLDVTSLDASLDALQRGNHGAAARAAARAGRNALARHVGRDVFRLDAERHAPGHPGFAWAAHARTTRTPDLWDELASLRREPGARPVGPWLERSLAQKRERSARELERRISRIAVAFERAAEQLA